MVALPTLLSHDVIILRNVLVLEGHLPSSTSYEFLLQGSRVPSLEKVSNKFFLVVLVPGDGGVPRRTHKHGEEGLLYIAFGAFLWLSTSTTTAIMPVATVKDGSLCFSYEDSGPLPMGEPYTTLVMVHGTGFHSGKQAC